MLNRIVLISIFLVFPQFSYGQDEFSGSFNIHYEESEFIKDFPMVWHIQPKSAGGKMAMEIQDEMKPKGVSKRILFDPIDSTWTMLIEYNKVKQGTSIRSASLFLDSIKTDKPILKKTKYKKVIDNYSCRKVILESDNYISELWITEEFRFDLCLIYRLLAHCGMTSDFVSKGDWYHYNKMKNFILEVTSVNKKTGAHYTLRINSVKPNETNPSFFQLKGFRISQIPEGQKCGPAKNEN